MAIWRFRCLNVGCTVGVMVKDELVLNRDGFSAPVELLTRPPLEWSVVMVIISEPSGSEQGVDESLFGVLASLSTTSTLLLGVVFTV